MAPPTEPVAATSRDARPASPGASEAVIVERLRAGDEAAFSALIEQHGGALRRFARMYTTEATVDDVVQETWIAVLRGIDRFEGRASLRTWLFRILINIARDRGEREQRLIPFSAFGDPAADHEAAVDPDRFRPSTDFFPGGWVSFPERWDEQPEASFLSSEGIECARAAIAALPPAQREVVTLRDVEGWSSDEVSNALGITPGNQRVLLHRGRSKVRATLEAALQGLSATPRGSTVQAGDDEAAHPDLERYYDSDTDRRPIDEHLAGCPECRAWLAAIHDRLRDLPCREFVELVTDYLDEAVDDRLRARIDDHLRLCEGCRSYLNELGATIATLGRVAHETPPAETVQAGLIVAFRAWSRSSGRPTPDARRDRGR